MHNGHVLKPARHYDYVYQKCDLCGRLWMTVDDCAGEDRKCSGEPRKLRIVGRIDGQYGWRKVVGAFSLLFAAGMFYGMAFENDFHPGQLGYLILDVVIIVISLGLFLLFWPDQ